MTLGPSEIATRGAMTRVPRVVQTRLEVEHQVSTSHPVELELCHQPSFRTAGLPAASRWPQSRHSAQRVRPRPPRPEALSPCRPNCFSDGRIADRRHVQTQFPRGGEIFDTQGNGRALFLGCGLYGILLTDA